MLTLLISSGRYLKVCLFSYRLVKIFLIFGLFSVCSSYKDLKTALNFIFQCATKSGVVVCFQFFNFLWEHKANKSKCRVVPKLSPNNRCRKEAESDTSHQIDFLLRSRRYQQPLLVFDFVSHSVRLGSFSASPLATSTSVNFLASSLCFQPFFFGFVSHSVRVCFVFGFVFGHFSALVYLQIVIGSFGSYTS